MLVMLPTCLLMIIFCDRSTQRQLRFSVRYMSSVYFYLASSGAMVECWLVRRNRRDSAICLRHSPTACQMMTLSSLCLTTMLMNLESGMSGSQGTHDITLALCPGSRSLGTRPDITLSLDRFCSKTFSAEVAHSELHKY